MAFITLDFETPYGKGVKEGHLLHKYTLTSMTYEEYIFDPRFKVFGVGIKINDEPSIYYSNRVNPNTVADVLRELFHEGNGHTVIAHNMMFDGAILSWYYKLSAARYWCTQAMSRGIWNQRSSSLEQLCKSCYPTDESIRKTKEIVLFQNLYELTKEQDQVMEGYCNNDVEVTFKCLQAMYKWMPSQELALLDLTLKMFIHPAFELNPERVQAFLESYNAETKRILDKAEIPRSTLASPKQFAAWVKANLDLEIPVIPSPTKNNPDNMKFALGKDEMAFVEFQANHSEHQHIWDARLRAASSIDKSRAERLLAHMQANRRIAAPLNYAAAHTLRWGGTNKINLQNLRRGSELRKALKAPKDYQVVVADLSNIEGRVNAWFCQEQSMLDIFEADGDLYCDFATKVFRRPINKDQHPSERFVGKTCLGEDTKVLTKNGWKKITEINTNDQLWDGKEWIQHTGLIQNGLQHTTTLAGVTATPDHEILIQEGLWATFETAQVDQGLFHLALSSATLPLSHTPHIPQRLENHGDGGQFANAHAERSTYSMQVISKEEPVKTATHALKKLAAQKDGSNIKQQCLTIATVVDSLTGYLQRLVDATINKTRNMIVMVRGASKSAKNGGRIGRLFLGTSKTLTAGTNQNLKWTESITMKGINPETCASVLENKTYKTDEKSPTYKKELTTLKPVYDIANAGPRNRFTILTNRGPVIVHNCILGLGYQTGPAKLRNTLYLGSNKQINLSLDECKKIVYEDYRGNYLNIVKGWADAEFAIGKMLSLPPGEVMQWRCLTVERGRIRLPNGMYLNYPRLTCSLDEYDRPQHSYWNGKHMTNLYGGKLIENIIQALARCVMAEMMVNINNWLTANQDRFGIEARVILTVHDEVIALAKTDYAEEVYSGMLEIMSTPPAWCNDGTLTLKAEGGYADEYSK